ncbi:unnamed protein product [Colias eurytheme]|nr:unnamed protein product [Colias eurytheme]
MASLSLPKVLQLKKNSLDAEREHFEKFQCIRNTGSSAAEAAGGQSPTVNVLFRINSITIVVLAWILLYCEHSYCLEKCALLSLQLRIISTCFTPDVGCDNRLSTISAWKQAPCHSVP